MYLLSLTFQSYENASGERICAISGESANSDQDFDVTAEMMVHDLDDEATMEEEELLADGEQDFADELEDLQKVRIKFSVNIS